MDARKRGQASNEWKVGWRSTIPESGCNHRSPCAMSWLSERLKIETCQPRSKALPSKCNHVTIWFRAFWGQTGYIGAPTSRDESPGGPQQVATHTTPTTGWRGRIFVNGCASLSLQPSSSDCCSRRCCTFAACSQVQRQTAMHMRYEHSRHTTRHAPHHDTHRTTTHHHGVVAPHRLEQLPHAPLCAVGHERRKHARRQALIPAVDVATHGTSLGVGPAPPPHTTMLSCTPRPPAHTYRRQ